MYARMTILPVRSDRIEEAIDIYRKSVLPAAKKQKGYRGACLLADRKGGKGISVTFWETEKSALENEKNRYYQEQLTKFLSCIAGPPIRENYEVVLHTLKRRSSLRTKKKR